MGNKKDDEKQSHESLPSRAVKTAENFYNNVNKMKKQNFFTVEKPKKDGENTDNVVLSRKQLKMYRKFENCVYTNPKFDYKKSQ